MNLMNLLIEIGQLEMPQNVIFGSKLVKFKFKNVKYEIKFRIPIETDDKFVVFIDFLANGNFDMTKQNEPLKVMGYIFGCIEEWIKRKNKRCIYIGYNPKSENYEIFDQLLGNKRDRIYRMYIQNIAKKYNSEVEFIVGPNVTAKFSPPLYVK